MNPWGPVGSLIAPALVSAVAALERELAGPEMPWVQGDALGEALRGGWSYVAGSAERSIVTFDPEFIVSVHQHLALPLGAPGVGAFRDGDPPQDWTTFVRVAVDDFMGPNDYAHWVGSGSEAWIFSQLFWGKHLESLAPSTAWLLMNGVRLQNGHRPVILDAGRIATFKDALQHAAPPVWDAETLRGLSGLW